MDNLLEKRYEECVKCACYFNNVDGEIKRAMDETQIECSNEYTYVNLGKLCFCFQKIGE